MLFDLITLGIIEGLKALPKGRGKRKAAAKYLDAEAKALASLRGDLEMAANSGEVLSGFALRMLVSRLGSMQVTMETTVNAILDQDDDEEPKG